MRNSENLAKLAVTGIVEAVQGYLNPVLQVPLKKGLPALFGAVNCERFPFSGLDSSISRHFQHPLNSSKHVSFKPIIHERRSFPDGPSPRRARQRAIDSPFWDPDSKPRRLALPQGAPLRVFLRRLSTALLGLSALPRPFPLRGWPAQMLRSVLATKTLKRARRNTGGTPSPDANHSCKTLIRFNQAPLWPRETMRPLSPRPTAG